MLNTSEVCVSIWHHGAVYLIDVLEVISKNSKEGNNCIYRRVINSTKVKFHNKIVF